MRRTGTHEAMDERLRLLRYTRPEQWPVLARSGLPGPAYDALLAGVVAVEPDEVRALVTSLDEACSAAAAELLTDAGYRRALDGLPFAPGDRVVAVGDSVTADRLGWFELLRSSLRSARPDGVEFHNLGLSGDTTADALERFDLIEACRPTHVLVMLGTNDARSHGRASSYRMVTPAETVRNLRALHELVTGDLGATATLITPPAADQARIDEFFAGQPLRWQASALAELAALVATVDPACIDVHRAMRSQDRDGLLEPDGVHPSVEGQRLIAATIVEALAGPRPSRPEISR